MRTFNPSFSSATYTSAVSPVPLRSGLQNNLSLDFGPGGDDAALNDDNYTEGKPINSQQFNALTVELAFNMNSVGGFQTLVGKDGKPTSSAVAPLQIKVRGDNFPDGINNELFVEWIDGDGDVHYLASGFSITTGNWNHVAFVLTATEAQLYMMGESGDYGLVDSIVGDDFAGPAGQVLINSTGNFTVGRGMFNNAATDWSDAYIDEVRISDRALSMAEFLFAPAGTVSAALVSTESQANASAAGEGDLRFVVFLTLSPSTQLLTADASFVQTGRPQSEAKLLNADQLVETARRHGTANYAVAGVTFVERSARDLVFGGSGDLTISDLDHAISEIMSGRII